MGRGEEWAQPASWRVRINHWVHDKRAKYLITTWQRQARRTRIVTASIVGAEDGALRRERQKNYRARLVSSARTHTLDELPHAIRADEYGQPGSLRTPKTPSTHPRSTLPPHASLTNTSAHLNMARFYMARQRHSPIPPPNGVVSFSIRDLYSSPPL